MAARLSRLLVAVELGLSADHVDCWFWLQPPLSRCVTFQPGWIAQMFLRNLGLLVAIAGGWHLLLYTFKVQGTERKYDPRWLRTDDPFLFRNQLYDNIFWSCVSGCTVWTAYEAVYMWCGAPTGSCRWSIGRASVYCAVWLCLIPFWREFHFYWIHRVIHWKPLYKHVHYLHHKNVNPGPWSGLAMHPVEHILISASCSSTGWCRRIRSTFSSMPSTPG